MTGILTEKPSVARDIAAALGINKKDGEYWEGDYNGETHVVTNCLGHLLELAEPPQYDPAYKTWSIEQLPIIPSAFKRLPLKESKKQLGIITKALKDCTKIIIATDAGREGELIGRSVLEHCGLSTKKLFRFWTSNALTPEVVRTSLADVKPAKNYNKLYDEAVARSTADWIVGMNYTRFFTKCTDTLFSVGRVQTALLAIIAANHAQRTEFISTKYYSLIERFKTDRGEEFDAIYTKDKQQRFDRACIQRLFKENTSNTGVVSEYSEKERTIQPPQLFSLTALQRVMNKKYKLSAKKTLEIAQKLYEKKVISYPRTPSSVMGEADVDLVRQKLKMVKDSMSDEAICKDAEVKPSDKRIFNDARLEDHHAIIPLVADAECETQFETLLFNEIVQRFVIAFNKPAVKKEQRAVIQKVNGLYEAKGSWYIERGFTQFEGKEEGEKSQPLPNLIEKETVHSINKEIKEGETSPPGPYTESSLLSVMEKPNRLLKQDDPRFERGAGIGTPATRAAIIETLKQREYIEVVKNNIEITPKGLQLIDVITPMNISITNLSETALWEERLKENPNKFYSDISSELSSTIERLKGEQLNIMGDIQKGRKVIGKCPKCNTDVKEYDKYWGCENTFSDPKCPFKIWKNQAGGTVSEDQAIKVITEGQSDPIEFFSKEKKKHYRARLKIEKSGEVKRQFDKLPAEPVGTCPACGGDVIEREKFFGCSNYKEKGCEFKLWKATFGTVIEKEQAVKLLSDAKKTDKLELCNKEGKKYFAKLKLESIDNNYKIKVELA